MNLFGLGGRGRLIVGLITLGLMSSAQSAELEFSSQSFQFPAKLEGLVIADTNGDNLSEIITVIDKTLRIYFQSAAGFDFQSGFDEIVFPGQAVGWDLSSNYSNSDQASIIAVIDGNEVLVWHIDSQTILPPKKIQGNLLGFLSKGVNRLHFSRDVNGDDIEDLLIPGAGILNIYISDGDGSYQAGLSVQFDMRIRTNLDSTQLERRTGQSIRIPLIVLRDVNGDGFDDLVSRTDEKLEVFIADALANNYFNIVPSYTLDITEIEARLGEFDIDNLDFANLTGILALTHEEILDDVDGDGIEDLLLREAGKISLFGGTFNGMELEQPRQVLRSGGNVLSTFLYDENEDGLKDLWLWRVESISIGDIFVWLALSGSVAIEAFIYPNEGKRFSRRPARKISVDLRFPSVIRLAATFQEKADEYRELQEQQAVPNNSANLDNNFGSEELLVLANNQIEIFLNAIEPSEDNRQFLGALNYTRERNEYEINIREIIDDISLNANSALAAVEGKTPDLTLDIDASFINGSGDIIPAKLNADLIDDVFIFTDLNSSHISGMLLLSK